MKYKSDGHNWIVRLEKGELLMECLTKLVNEQNIKGGWISGIGAAIWAEVAYYDPAAKGYESKKLDELLEITSLQGNVAWEAPLDSGKPFFHIHGTFANAEMRGYGGHIMELEVGGTCEIFLHSWSKGGLTRFEDDETGLKLLDL